MFLLNAKKQKYPIDISNCVQCRSITNRDSRIVVRSDACRIETTQCLIEVIAHCQRQQSKSVDDKHRQAGMAGVVAAISEVPAVGAVAP